MLQSNGGDYTPVFGARAKYSKFKTNQPFRSRAFRFSYATIPSLSWQMK
jgi:hypothetical protein